MVDFLVPFLEQMANYGLTWGPFLVFLFMTIESSFVPFPSEIVMIPAGFMAARGEFYPGTHEWYALFIAISCGISGSLLGAYLNYFLSMKFGRPFLYRWGKYVLLSPAKLEQAEGVFRKYGEVTTFVCRLIPVVRQLISIPAGISKMNFFRFSVFTMSGAGIWVMILALLGYWFGTTTEGMSYTLLVHEGKALLDKHLFATVFASALIITIYVWVHQIIEKK